jgi:hypothetical protein
VIIKRLVEKIFKFKYRFRLPVIYIFLILLGLLTVLIPPLNDCSGGMFLVCIPVSGVIILLLSVPGMLLINQLDFIIPRKYYSWTTHSENFLWVVLISYAVTIILLFLLGLIIDKLRRVEK